MDKEKGFCDLSCPPTNTMRGGTLGLGIVVSQQEEEIDVIISIVATYQIFKVMIIFLIEFSIKKFIFKWLK